MKATIKKLVKNEQGSTMVELVMVMVLLILFGATIYTLIYAGSETQSKIIEAKTAQVEARIATSYINVRLRQYDEEGAVFIKKNPINDQDSIVLVDLNSERQLETWIFWSDGVLKECLIYPEEQVSDAPGMFTPIANIEGFETKLIDNRTVYNKITYSYNDKVKTLESETYLRSLR